MSKRTDILILCAGGHSRVVIDILRRAGENPTAIVDADPRLHGKDLDGVPIIGDDEAVFERRAEDVVLVNALGNAPRRGAGGLDIRRLLFERFTTRGYKFMRVISPNAAVSTVAVLEDGCHIITGAIVHPGAVIGVNAIINTGAQVDHDCLVGAHSHVAPGAVLCGRVTLGPECHIGAGAVVTQNISVGAGAIIGAGAVVVADVAANATVFGSPARSAKV